MAHHEDEEMIWTHGIDESQNEVIEKAMRQYEKRTGQRIGRNAILKRIIMNFGQDMDIVSADMVHSERRHAWEEWIRKG